MDLNDRDSPPRLTERDLDKKIRQELYHLFPGTQTTVCLLLLENGYSVVGESAPSDPDNFVPVKGRKVAKRHAFSKLWAICGYANREIAYLEAKGH